MKTLRLAIASLAAVPVLGCAPMIVGANSDPAVRPVAPATYEWGPRDALPTGDARLDNNEFFDARVRLAIEEQLASRGFTKATDETPDFLVHYHVTVTDAVDIVTVDRERGYTGTLGNETATYVFDEGMLVVDMIEAESNRLVWRGWARSDVTGLIDRQEDICEHMSEAAGRIFRLFPQP